MRRCAPGPAPVCVAVPTGQARRLPGQAWLGAPQRSPRCPRRRLPACAALLQVGLVTFGTHVHVHEIGFTECPRAYVFRGSKDYSAAQVRRGRGSRRGQAAVPCSLPECAGRAGRVLGDPRGRSSRLCLPCRAIPSHHLMLLAVPAPKRRPSRSRSSWACTARRRSGERARPPARSRAAPAPAAWRRAPATASSCRCRSASSWSQRHGAAAAAWAAAAAAAWAAAAAAGAAAAAAADASAAAQMLSGRHMASLPCQAGSRPAEYMTHAPTARPLCPCRR